jgi:hypothetical protein
MSHGPSGASVHDGPLPSRSGALARAAPFDRSGQRELAVTEGKRRGELGNSHCGLHRAAQGLSWLDGDEQRRRW